GNAGATQTDIVTVVGVDNENESVTDTDDAIVGITNVVPQVVVEKTVNPDSRPEPGGDFTYTVVVFNNSNEPLTITSLTDNVYGNLVTRANSTCNTAIGTVLAAGGGSYTCTFTAPFTGNAGARLTDVVTVTAVDDEGTVVTDNDDAVVRLTPVPPLVQVDKTANPTSRPEPGGDFAYTVVVTNTSTVERLTITSLTDSVYGNLATRGTCTTAIGTVLAVSPGPGNTYTCQFTAPFTGNAGASLTDVVTVVGVDDDNQTATDTDDAVVTLTNVPPTVGITKTADPLSRPEPGGDFTYTVVVTNTSNEPVTITSLTDNIYGNLTTRANSTCNTALGTVLQPAGTYTCTFTAPFTGNAGAALTDIATVVVVDNDNTTATANDDARVTLTDVPPTITAVKTPTPLSRPEPGGSFRFDFTVTNTSNEPVTVISLVDDVYGDLNGRGTCAVGAVLAPGASYSCSFEGNFFGDGGASQTDTITVTAVDDEGTTVTARPEATVRITDVPPTVTVEKTADPASRPEPGGSFTFRVRVTNTSFERVQITNLTDDVYGDLNGRGTCAVGAILAPNGGTYTCEFTGDFRGAGGSAQTDVVTVRVVDNEGTSATDSDDARVTITPPPPPPPPPPPKVLVRTGADSGFPLRMASGLVVVD
ncbi:MAG: hypothetical protein LC708_02470, partial [Actinobacteria bacterium]|nr:hypothetical protein [Actinomycetota bacterium]